MKRAIFLDTTGYHETGLMEVLPLNGEMPSCFINRAGTAFRLSVSRWLARIIIAGLFLLSVLPGKTQITMPDMLKPADSWGLIDVNSLYGGFMQVDSYTALQNVRVQFLKRGMIFVVYDYDGDNSNGIDTRAYMFLPTAGAWTYNTPFQVPAATQSKTIATALLETYLVPVSLGLSAGSTIIADNTISASKLKGASSAALANGIAGNMLQSNGDGTFSWGSATLPSLSGLGAATADVSLSGFKIINLADPFSAQDAATKKYVDNTVGSETTRATAAEGANTSAIALKANIASPAFTGTPTAPTPTAGDATTSLATTAFVASAVTTAVSGATIPDADASTKGKIKLAGDLTGTADLPTVANNAITTAKIADANITTAKILDANVTTSKIADANVTYAKVQPVAASSLLGNPAAAAAPVSEITLGTGLSLTGNVLNTTNSGVAGTFTSDIIVRTANGLGKYAQNSTIPATGKTANEVLIDAFTQTIPPTYVGPSVSMTTAGGTVEIGSTVPVSLTSVFTAHNAGAASGTIYSKGGVSLGAGVVSDNITSITSTTSYTATVTYAQGACLNNNLGVQDCTGQIAAGSVTSAAITFIPSAQRYWGRCSGVPNSATIITAGGGGNELSTSKTKTGFSVTASGSNNIYFAYPAALGALTAISVGGFDSFSAFTQNTVSFTNASNYTQNYFVYVSNNTFSGDATNINVQ